MTKIIIVDDQNSIREFLKLHLANEPDLQIVGIAENGEAAIRKVEEYRPDIVLMDIEMPTMDGIVATQIISQRFPATRVILLTSKDNRQQLNMALKAGARGYILKNTSSQDIGSIIRLATKGFFQFGPILSDWDHSDATAVESNPQAPPQSAQSSGMVTYQDQAVGMSNMSVSESTEMHSALSNLTSGLFQLQKTIESQENTIVNLANQYSEVQHQITTKLSDKRFLNELKNYNNQQRKFKPNLGYRKQNVLFITSFLLGVFTLAIIIALMMGITVLLP